jgi:rhodanese-related sulfurtransferase
MTQPVLRPITAENAKTLLDRGDAVLLDGGLAAWKHAGLPVVADRRAPLPIMRQVQIAAGSLVLLGVILAVLVSPWFMALSAFVGAGLVMAGVTGFCGLANLLAHMPWNRRSQAIGPRDADRLAPAR